MKDSNKTTTQNYLRYRAYLMHQKQYVNPSSSLRVMVYCTSFVWLLKGNRALITMSCARIKIDQEH